MTKRYVVQGSDHLGWQCGRCVWRIWTLSSTPCVVVPSSSNNVPVPYAWTDDARDSRIEISHDQLLAASWSSRFSLQLRPHSFDCPGGYWRSAAGEPRDDDQLDDCYCIGAGREQLSISGISRWLANQVIRQARCISRFPFQDMVGLWIFGDPRRAERVELATHRALRDRRAPVPSSSREVYCLKDLEHVQQTLRQTMKLSNQQLLQLQSEDLKDARRNKRGQQMPEASPGYWVCSFSSSSCKTRIVFEMMFHKRHALRAWNHVWTLVSVVVPSSSNYGSVELLWRRCLGSGICIPSHAMVAQCLTSGTHLQVFLSFSDSNWPNWSKLFFLFFSA